MECGKINQRGRQYLRMATPKCDSDSASTLSSFECGDSTVGLKQGEVAPSKSSFSRRLSTGAGTYSNLGDMLREVLNNPEIEYVEVEGFPCSKRMLAEWAVKYMRHSILRETREQSTRTETEPGPSSPDSWKLMESKPEVADASRQSDFRTRKIIQQSYCFDEQTKYRLAETKKWVMNTFSQQQGYNPLFPTNFYDGDESDLSSEPATQEAPPKALLVGMDKGIGPLVPTVSVAKEEPVTTINEVRADQDVPLDSIMLLDNLLRKLVIAPEYEVNLSPVLGNVHTVTCRLGSHIVETGRAPKWRVAKRAAAYRVYKRLMETLPKDGSAVSKTDNVWMEKLNSWNLVSKEVATRVDCHCDGSADWKLTTWMDNLRNRSGPQLDQLKVPRAIIPSNDPCELMRKISEEQKFKLNIAELANVRSRSTDMKEYLIAISTGNQLMTVLMSTAGSKAEAKKKAAEQFIVMLSSVLTSPNC